MNLTTCTPCKFAIMLHNINNAESTINPLRVKWNCEKQSFPFNASLESSESLESYLVNACESALIREISSIMSPRLITRMQHRFPYGLPSSSHLVSRMWDTIPDFRERYQYERAPSRTSAVNRAKTLRQIKKYGKGPMSCTLARNCARDFFSPAEVQSCGTIG